MAPFDAHAAAIEQYTGASPSSTYTTCIASRPSAEPSHALRFRAQRERVRDVAHALARDDEQAPRESVIRFRFRVRLSHKCPGMRTASERWEAGR